MQSQYFRVNNIQETIELLDKYQNQQPELLAGGTDIMVKERNNLLDTNKVHKKPFIIDINPMKKEIGKIELSKNNNGESILEIGALATYTDILESEIINNNAPIIAKSSFAVGGRQIQNMGTIGGMLGTATPAADVTLALLSMDAQVVLYSKKGYRTIPLNEFFTGYRETQRKANEIITKIICPIQTNNEEYDYIKVGGRKGQIIAITAFCGRLVLDEKKIIKDAFLSVASSAPYSIRIPKVENFIKEKSRDFLKNLNSEEEYYIQLTKLINDSLSPIDEVIATKEYKRYCAFNLILDFLLNRK